MTIDRRAVIAGLSLAPILGALPASADAAPRRKEVLAFYYGWYATQSYSDIVLHWPPESPMLDTPVDGPYDSLDPAVIQRHAGQAKAAGLTGLVASWWGQGDRTDRQLPRLLDACHAQGLKVCAYVEQAGSVDSVAKDVLYLHERYAGHPAWLRLDDKPVIMFFDRLVQTLGLDGWDRARKAIEAKAPGALAFIGTANDEKEIAERRDHFDAVHIYSQQFAVAHPHLFRELWTRGHYHDWVRAQAGLAVTTATVLPGFDDHLIEGRPGKRPIVERDDGKAYGDLWLNASKADPDWIFVVSFNEWHEGSEIEPSAQYGDSYLKATADYSRAFLTGKA
ncbi:MAG TPA: glycoside hydrolase family 99-like domain-containing protein [Asticcacaulis sp.]|nr:glycoside hydrolase family 99-like domain-containing protein [Asticcacaulis sp.]